MLKIGEPISWSIKIEPVNDNQRILKQRYRLDYVEIFPNDKKHLHAAQVTKEIMLRTPFFANNNIEITEKGENIEIHYNYIGKKQTIIDMIAGEFISFSTFGKMSFQEIFTKLTVEVLLK